MFLKNVKNMQNKSIPVTSTSTSAIPSSTTTSTKSYISAD